MPIEPSLRDLELYEVENAEAAFEWLKVKRRDDKLRTIVQHKGPSTTSLDAAAIEWLRPLIPSYRVSLPLESDEPNKGEALD